MEGEEKTNIPFLFHAASAPQHTPGSFVHSSQRQGNFKIKPATDKPDDPSNPQALLEDAPAAVSRGTPHLSAAAGWFHRSPATAWGGPGGGAGRAPRGRTAKWFGPDAGLKRRGARKGERTENQRRLHGDKTAAGTPGPGGSQCAEAPEQEVPAPPSEPRAPPSRALTSRHLFGRARRWFHPPCSPHTRPRRGRAKGAETLDPQPEGASAAVPDISRGSLSPLLGGEEGDDTGPATFAPPGSRRSGS